MQSIRINSGTGGSRQVIIRSKGKRACGAVAALIGAVAFLSGTIQLDGQSRTATASLILQVRPEESLQAQYGGVLLKIRLARGTTAQLWAADACTAPPAQPYVIATSGVYSIPFSALIPVSNEGSQTTTQVCLVSSDGLLHDSLSVEIFGRGDSLAVQELTPPTAPGGVSAAVPLGIVVTAQAGTTTWSNP
jgi:hypothetical protein